MTDRKIEEALDRAAAAIPHDVDPTVLERIAGAVHSSMQPVRPLPRSGVLILAVLVSTGGLAVATACWLGFAGVRALGMLQRAIIFPALAVLAWVTARELVNQWIPGSRRYLAPTSLVVLVSVALLSVFALELHDYRAEHFVSAGVACLSVGVLQAIPVACLAAWLLRRGLAVEPVSAGTIAGALGGISGVMMLELHCPNLEAPHVLVWHVGVVVVSALVGAVAGWMAGRGGRAGAPGIR